MNQKCENMLHHGKEINKIHMIFIGKTDSTLFEEFEVFSTSQMRRIGAYVDNKKKLEKL